MRSAPGIWYPINLGVYVSLNAKRKGGDGPMSVVDILVPVLVIVGAIGVVAIAYLGITQLRDARRARKTGRGGSHMR